MSIQCYVLSLAEKLIGDASAQIITVIKYFRNQQWPRLITKTFFTACAPKESGFFVEKKLQTKSFQGAF